MVFYGDLGLNCRNLIDYFEGIPGVAPLPKGYKNPATWMLECIGAGVNNSVSDNTDFVEHFNKSSYNQQLQANMAKEGITVPSPDLPEIVVGKKRAAGSMTQMRFVVTRFFQIYWRTPSYSLTRLVMSVFLALIFGIVLINGNYASYSGLNSGVDMVFMAALFLSMMAFNSVVPLTSSERPSFYRERASQTYNSFWYFFGIDCCGDSMVFLERLSVHHCAVSTRWFHGFHGWCALLGGHLAHGAHAGVSRTIFTYAMPTEEVAAIIGLLFNAVLMMFMGYNPPASSIPQGYQWLYTISPQKFLMCILVALCYTKCGELPSGMKQRRATSTSAQILVAADGECTSHDRSHDSKGVHRVVLRLKYDEIGQNFGIVLGCIVLFRIWAALALRFINHQKR